MMNYDLDRKPTYLLTIDGNPKVAKGEKLGYYTAILHLAPHKLSGFNVCASATKGCIASCLNTAGRGGIGIDANGYNAIQIARIRRTRFFKRDRAGFMDMLRKEIDAHIRRATAKGFLPAFRLNGTSDLPWERLKFHGHRNVFEAYPDVQFYDYTKIPVAKRDLTIPNYHLTFSLAESNRRDAIAALNAGLNVAAVVRVRKSQPIPSPINLGGYRAVIDGDETDVRFSDAAGRVIGLRAKGKAKKDTTGFVLDV
jgi:hypothetical protein